MTVSSTHDPVRVAISVVTCGAQVLIGPRPTGSVLEGFWEFPGGKALPGEDLVDSAQRECQEETGLTAKFHSILPPIVHAYAHGTVELHVFHAAIAVPCPQAAAPFRWIPLQDLTQFRFPPANDAILAWLERYRATGTEST